MTPQELKNSILQLAIQGKLVEQRPEEGTAAELLEKIARHGTTGTHGITKTTGTTRTKSRAAHRASSVPSVSSVSVVPSVPDDEKPFDIPESWEWVRLGDVADVQLGKMLDKGKNKGTPYPYLANLSVRWRSFDLSALRMMPFTEIECEKYALVPGDVLMCEGGVPGRCAVWREKNSSVKYQKAVHRIRSSVLFPDFTQRYFEAICDSSWFVEKFTGTTIKHLPRETLRNTLIPLPPLTEQKRIVAKIEELLPLIDRYEKAWSKLEDFNRRFPVDMQKSVLQMAIQGKLVDQRPEEGTGEELLDKIFAAKNAKGAKKNLTRSRGARGEKNTSALSASPREAIPDDEKPFDIPESWVWVRVGDVCTNIQYGSSKKSAPTGTVPVLRMGNIQNGRIDYSKLVFTSDEDEIRKYSLEVDDLLFNRTNSKELVGKVALYKGERPAIYAGYLVRLTPVNISADYLNYVMQSQYYWGYCQSVRSDAIGQSNINAEKLKRFVVPLPPLAEQKRIVAKLEEILPLCERLK